MGTALPPDVPLPDELQIRLVDHFGGLKFSGPSFTAEGTPRQSIDLGIDDRNELVERTLVSISPGVEQLRHFARIGRRVWIVRHGIDRD
jgi:hypothetical protein